MKIGGIFYFSFSNVLSISAWKVAFAIAGGDFANEKIGETFLAI
jgi:hypothetical protein